VHEFTEKELLYRSLFDSSEERHLKVFSPRRPHGREIKGYGEDIWSHEASSVEYKRASRCAMAFLSPSAAAALVFE